MSNVHILEGDILALKAALRTVSAQNKYLEAEIERLRAAISGAIEAIERGSTSAPVLECLKSAILNEQVRK